MSSFPLSIYSMCRIFIFFIGLCKNHKLIHSIRFSVQGPTISHLFFTNDNLVFSKATTTECNHLKELFDLYSNAFGQVINFQKSSLFFSLNTLWNIREAINHIFNLFVISHHEQYLGLPSMLGRSKILFFNTLKTWLWHKIKDWKRAIDQSCCTSYPYICNECLLARSQLLLWFAKINCTILVESKFILQKLSFVAMVETLPFQEKCGPWFFRVELF